MVLPQPHHAIHNMINNITSQNTVWLPTRPAGRVWSERLALRADELFVDPGKKLPLVNRVKCRVEICVCTAELRQLPSVYRWWSPTARTPEVRRSCYWGYHLKKSYLSAWTFFFSGLPAYVPRSSFMMYSNEYLQGFTRLVSQLSPFLLITVLVHIHELMRFFHISLETPQVPAQSYRCFLASIYLSDLEKGLRQ